MCGGYVLLKEASVKKSRKEHCCSWCPETILKGKPYESYTGIYQGDFSVVKMHPECVKAQESMDHDEICDGWELHSFKRGTTNERDYPSSMSDRRYMIVKREQKGIEVFLNWSEAKDLREILEGCSFGHTDSTKELLYELEEILTEEGS